MRKNVLTTSAAALLLMAGCVAPADSERRWTELAEKTKMLDSVLSNELRKAQQLDSLINDNLTNLEQLKEKLKREATVADSVISRFKR